MSGDSSQLRINDLGGAPDFWRNVNEKPEHVTVVNLRDTEGSLCSGAVDGNACNVPSGLIDRSRSH